MSDNNMGDNVNNKINNLLKNANTISILEECIHMLLMMIIIHVLWRKYKPLLFLILSIMLGYETFIHNDLSVYYVLIVSFGCYIGELLFLLIHKYPWRYESGDTIPLWKLPFWGIFGIHIAKLSMSLNRGKN